MTRPTYQEQRKARAQRTAQRQRQRARAQMWRDIEHDPACMMLGVILAVITPGLLLIGGVALAAALGVTL